jgi:thiamine pyrophosphokinase
MNALIICNGSISDYSYYKKYFAEADMVICADGGADHARRFGIKPDFLVGDFDSVNNSNLDYFREIGTNILTFPAEKDMTDTELAVEFAVDKGATTVTIIGGIGTRFDHTLSNVLILRKLLSLGVKGIIADENNEITLIDSSIKLQKERNTKVSILPLTSRVEGITNKGLYYSLDNFTLDMGSSRGVSNEFISDTAEISIRKGLLLVIKSRD